MSAPAAAAWDVGRIAVAVFGVAARGRTYTRLLYLLLSLPLGLFYVLLLGSGMALGALLAITGVGLLLLLGCLVAAWAFALFERELAVTLLGADVPPMSAPDRGLLASWKGLIGHLGRSVTWKSMAFLILKFPLGIVVATATGLLLAGSVLLITTPLRILNESSWFQRPVLLPLMAWMVLLGVALILLALHIANWIGLAWAGLARIMLGVAQEERDLIEARRRAEAAERSRRELILNVSHELRTPIASIQGHVDTLLLPPEDRPADATPDHYLKVVSGETHRLGALVEELLDLARADAHELKVQMRPVALAAVVRSVVATFAPMARRERLVAVAHPEALPDLVGLADPDRLTQVLANLVRNAVTHTPEGGAVLVSLASLPPDRVAIDVADTGIGIAPEDRERIFERFYRGDPSRSRDTGGFGLGLAIARELAEAMGGSLTVTSEPNVGSTFRVTLRQR
ncbi:MAG TPA: ATP-binding protein [Terriglobales bacterium]|nr:ATP-binding protein [Terriglobales bacterium]